MLIYVCVWLSHELGPTTGTAKIIGTPALFRLVLRRGGIDRHAADWVLGRARNIARRPMVMPVMMILVHEKDDSAMNVFIREVKCKNFLT